MFAAEEVTTDTKNTRIIDIGLNQLRYYPNEQHCSNIKREYPAHIFTGGEWRLDTFDPPMNVRILGDRWDRYDRRDRQRIISRVYVLPRDVEEWRQIIIARDIDTSPAGRMNWSRVQDEYADRFRTFLEDPSKINYIIVCVHDGVTNICDFQEDHDSVILQQTPSMIVVTRDQVQDILERDIMYSERLPYYFLNGRKASDAEYEIIMRNLMEYQNQHELAFRNSGLPRFEYRLRYQQTIYDNFGMPPADLMTQDHSYPRPGMMNHPSIHIGHVTDDPDIIRLEELMLKAECDYAYRRDVHDRRDPPPPENELALPVQAVYQGVELRSDSDLATVLHQDRTWKANCERSSKEWDKARRRKDRKYRVSKDHLLNSVSLLIGLSRTERLRYLQLHSHNGCKLDKLFQEILDNLKMVQQDPELDTCDSDNSSLSDEEIFRNRQERMERLEKMREQNRIDRFRQLQIDEEDVEQRAEIKRVCKENNIDLYGSVDMREWYDGADDDEENNYAQPKSSTLT